jgi:hypothetical protein
MIEGKAQTPAEKRETDKAAKEAEAGRWTIDKLWQEYKVNKAELKGWKTYGSLYNLLWKIIREPKACSFSPGETADSFKRSGNRQTESRLRRGFRTISGQCMACGTFMPPCWLQAGRLICIRFKSC